MNKVSVVIPVYNAARYLTDCLDSLLSQTLRELEMICVDDGSTDESPDILARYASRDDRVRVITQPNGGYGRAMNAGIDHATGEYVGILEADDVAPPEMYGKLYAAAKRARAEVVKADFYRFETIDGARVLARVPLSTDEGWYGRIVDPAREPDALKLTMNTWSGIYLRSFLTENKIRHNETPGASYQDNGFFFQTMCLARRALFVREPYYMNRRDNPGSSVYDKGKVYAMCGEMAFVKDFLEAHGLWETFKDVYYFKLLSNYEFTYRRIAEAARSAFLSHISAEFQAAEESGDLDIGKSYTQNEAARVRILIDAPETYPAYGAQLVLEARIHALESELSAIKSSASYRAGRLLTAVPRRLRSLLRRKA
jgi:glycosyltransferase involved in cell wall biosynthesis